VYERPECGKALLTGTLARQARNMIIYLKGTILGKKGYFGD